MQCRTGKVYLVTELVLQVFRLSGRLLRSGDELTRPAGISSARWQVLGAVAQESSSMAAIARGIGRTRQSVRELTDKLVADGLAETIANEADRRAPLVRITDQGNAVLHDVGPRQLRWATRLAEGFTSEELRTTLKVLQRLEASLTETEGDT